MTTTTTPRSLTPPATRRAGVRGPAAALLAFLVVLPLEWTAVVGAAGGFIKPFHLAAAVLVVVCVARWRPARLVGPVWHRHVGVFGAYAVVLAIAGAATVARADPVVPLDLVLRQMAYAAATIVMTGCVALVAGTAAQRWLAFSGVTATAVLLVGFAVALAKQSINPLTLLTDALARADPDVISYQLLRTVFRTDADLTEVAANLRHKVFVGLLVAVYLGLACSAMINRRQRLLRAVLAAGAALGFLLVLVSLSRSTILCMAVPPVLFLLRLLLRNRARPGQVAGVVVAIAAALAAAVSPLGDLLTARFADTASYTARLTAAGPSFVDQLAHSALLGTDGASVGTTPHNAILNAWLAGGVLAAVAATVMLVAFLVVWLRELRRYLTDGPGWVLQVGQLWVLAIGATFLVRSFSSGNQFHMVDLTAMGLFLGLTFANERAARATSGPGLQPGAR